MGNINGAQNLINASIKNNVKKVIYSSTSSGYGSNDIPNIETQPDDCLNPYSVTKISAEKIKAEIRSQAEDDVKKIKDEANNQIQVEKDKAISEIRQEVVTLTMSVAEKVIGKNLSVEDNQQLIEKSILDLKKHEA